MRQVQNKKRKASLMTTPIVRLPSASNTTAGQPARRRRNKSQAVIESTPTINTLATSNDGAGHASTDTQMPCASPDEPTPPASGSASSITISPAALHNDGGGQCGSDALPANASAIEAIRELQAHRVATIKAQLRLDNQCRALARRAMGWRLDMPEKERAALNAKAEKLVKAIQDGEAIVESKPMAEVLRPFCLASLAAREHFDAYRKGIEKDMERLAKTLPAAGFVDSIKGFGFPGLATIVGEAGDIGSYSNPAKLWKRLGLAVFFGKSQRKSTNAEEAAIQGYNPRRRSAIYTLGDSLIKGNKNPDGTDGYYRTLYVERKAYEISRDPEMSKMHAHRRAQRYMEKRLLRELWRAWCAAVMGNGKLAA